MSRQLRHLLWLVLSGAAGIWFGIVCRSMGRGYALFALSRHGLLQLIGWLLLLAVIDTIIFDLVAALSPDLFAAVGTFLVAGVGLWLGWELSMEKAGFAILLISSGTVQTVLTQRELRQETRFSAGVVSRYGQITCLVMLVMAVCSFYMGLREGGAVQDLAQVHQWVDGTASDLANEIVTSTVLSEVSVLQSRAKASVEKVLIRRALAILARWGHLVPGLLSILLLVLLLVVSLALWWLITVVLHLAFAILVRTGLVQVVTETIEIRRPVAY